MKKFEQGNRLAEWNHRKRQKLAKAQKSKPKLTYYGAGAVVAIGALGVLGYCVYRFKNQTDMTPVHRTNDRPKEGAHKFKME